MSYREVRNLLEMLRALGYPHAVSTESFRKPNFPLVADLLIWLSKRFDSDIDIPLEISTEDERVKLVRNAAQFMAVKGNVKLNTKRLYQADGYAVKELIKVTSLLYDALNVNLADNEENELNEESSFNARQFDISDKINDLKLSRQLASEITSTGATLFDLLGKEVEMRSARQKSVGRQFELAEVEAGVKKAIEAIKQEIAGVKQLIENVAQTEASLDQKIERRKIELDRYEKRLQTLKKVRPAFLEEFQALEQELEQLFVQYSLRLRILNQLTKEFAETERIQLEKQMLIESPRVQTIPLENDGDKADVLFDIEASVAEGQPRPGAINRQERPRASTGGRRADRNPKAFGLTQSPLLSGSHSSLDLSTDSETDDIFVDKEEPELMQDDDEDESLALELSGLDVRASTGRKTSSKVQEQNSDDDF